MRMRLSKGFCALLCVLLVIGPAGAMAGEYSVNYEVETRVGTWEELNEAAEKGAAYILVTDNIYFTRSDHTVVFTYPVVIRGDGDEPVIIDGGNSERIFLICGVAVLVIGDLYALHCTFTGNGALSGYAVCYICGSGLQETATSI